MEAKDPKEESSLEKGFNGTIGGCLAVFLIVLAVVFYGAARDKLSKYLKGDPKPPAVEKE